MCDKAIIENRQTLKSVPDCYKNQEMCNKAVENYPPALEFVSECYKTPKICYKAVNTNFSTIKFVPEFFMTQESVIKQLIDAFLYLILFNVKVKKCMIESFLKIFFYSILSW